MEELKCPICGKETANIYGKYNRFGLCKEHSKQQKDGLIEQCPDCGKWKKAGEECECKKKINTKKSAEQNCIICGKPSNGKPICRNCYYEMLENYDELDYLQSFEGAKEYYYNLKNSIFWIKKMEYAQTACKKLYAIAKIMDEIYYTDAIQKAIDDIKYLLTKKQEYLNKSKIEKEEPPKEKELIEHDDLNINEEIADYRRTYPATIHCNDGHYVRSQNERIIDDTLYRERVFHEYEKRYKAIDGNTYYPDFYLPDYRLFIEFFGVEENKNKNENKRKIFIQDKDYNWEFIEYKKRGILDEEIIDIIDKYKKKIRKGQ